MTTIYFVRHGALDGDTGTVLHGISDEVSLSQGGRNQMESTGKFLKSSGVVLVTSSSESRTRESAEILGNILRVAPQQDPRLAGRNWGAWAGRLWSAVEQDLSGLSIEQRYDHVPPGGESWRQFEKRTLEALEALVLEHANKAICVVSHGSVIRVLMPKVFKIPTEESLRRYPDYGSIWAIQHDGSTYLNPQLS